MFNDLTEKEQLALNLLVKEELEKDFDIPKGAIEDETLISLKQKGYVNLDVSPGFQGNSETSFNYQVNGHKLSDKVLEYYNIKK